MVSQPNFACFDKSFVSTTKIKKSTKLVSYRKKQNVSGTTIFIIWETFVVPTKLFSFGLC